MKKLTVLGGVALGLALATGGCNDLQARAAFKEGNKLYKEESFKRAIESYAEALRLDPSMVEAHFYLASSHQAVYRPGKVSPENDEHLAKAVEGYKKVLEMNDQSTPNKKQLLRNSLGALTGIYSEDPRKDFDQAFGFAQQLVQDNPSDIKNLFALANLYDKFQRFDDAEKTYREAFDKNPNDSKACGALAAFLNKPNWNARSKFDEAVDTLKKCAALTPDDPAGHYKVATFYWDKAYRDPDLNDKQKDAYANMGLEFVDKALAINPAYVDALIYKGLLCRVKALATTNLRDRQKWLDDAGTYQKRAIELKKQSAAGGISG